MVSVALPAPLRAGGALGEEAFGAVHSAMALDHFKWDAQLGDVTALASFPLLVSRATWAHLAALAESLAAETLALEQALLTRPDLHHRLALPRALQTLLGPAAAPGIRTLPPPSPPQLPAAAAVPGPAPASPPVRQRRPAWRCRAWWGGGG